MEKKKPVARSVEDKKRLYNKIITEGRRLFVKHGSEGFSMRTLAKELGMTHGNLYNYVESKRELWIAIRRYDMKNLKTDIEKIVNNSTRSYINLIEELTLYYMNFAREHYHSFQMLFFISIPKAKTIGKIEANYIPIQPFEIIKDVLRKGIQAGEIKNVEPEYLSYVIFSLIHGAITMENEFRFHSKILEPIVTQKGNDPETFRIHVLNSLKLILKP